MLTKVDPIWVAHAQDGPLHSFELTIPQDLDYFRGHFNGAPVLPGVVQLQWAIRKAQQTFQMAEYCARLDVVKFQHLQLPGQSVTLELERLDDTRVRFAYFSGDKRYSSGRIVFEAESA
ncbi:thioester dehydrase [Ferrimonas sp. YFM]|uniref:ApeI family dehydratase n=1 Tax=Ferrimonas sp. YFM TaxID=3028878 RepID=UPI00257325E3|nr:thioester dehydrase [Ferrimonas sp. YFM]BDY04383.1 thioester dehydrase [Ferrimonas sp. YFM]